MEVNRVVLVIVDGFGISTGTTNNAVYLADTPNLDELFGKYPHTLLEASGEAVGLPHGQMGNSEVGHIAMGSGCIVAQDLVRINKSIESGEIFDNAVLVAAIQRAKKARLPLHLMGLLSDGGVHSHIHHLLALIDMLGRQECGVKLHCFTDGRDSGQKSVLGYLDQVEKALSAFGMDLVSVMGRYYAMDRDSRWDRTKKAWEALTQGVGDRADSANHAVLNAYAKGQTDEFIEPTILPGFSPLGKDDCAVLFNFRNDRPRQLLRSLVKSSFTGFERGNISTTNVITMTEIDPSLKCPLVFSPMRPKTTLAREISKMGLRQFHCAETEKYPHVTFFFNGGKEMPEVGESRKMIPSPMVSTYDQCPQMRAGEIADAVIHAIRSAEFHFVVLNFANMDMVGHTASPQPIISAVEEVDKQIGRIVEEARGHGWTVVITSDHGNCDEFMDEITSEPNTRHTTNPVPFLVVSDIAYQLVQGHGIGSIAPTILDIMGLDIPRDMDAGSVLHGLTNFPYTPTCQRSLPELLPTDRKTPPPR